MTSKAALVAALEKRFDFQSIRVILRETLGKADLAEQDYYAEDEIARFLAALKTIEKRIDKVIAHLAAPAPAEVVAESAPVLAVEPASEPEHVPVAEPEVVAEPAAQPEQAPSDEAPASDVAPQAEGEPAEAEPQSAEGEPHAETEHGERQGGGKKKKNR